MFSQKKTDYIKLWDKYDKEIIRIYLKYHVEKFLK